MVHPLLAGWSRLRRSSNPKLRKNRMGKVEITGPVGTTGPIGTASPIDIWIHAASVGETKIAAYLIDFLFARNAHLRLHLSVMTEAGYNAAESLLPESVSLSYLPFDTPASMAAAFDRLRPKMIVITETEIWPNFLLTASARGLPVVLVNGRMSTRAFGRYRFVRRGMAPLLNAYDRFFFKTEEDAGRFAALGADPERSEIAGDMKFDAPPVICSEGRRREIRYRVGAADDSFLLVAGSTRPGEEELLINAMQSANQKEAGTRLVLAPRHVDRADEIRGLLESSKIRYFTYGDEPKEGEIVLVDKMGQLMELYAACDAAFVGGTLADIGGHNLLEPVWAGRPVLFGPSLANVQEAAEYIIKHNFGQKVESVEELSSVITGMMEGRLKFAQRSADDLALSPTAVVGKYLLSRLQNV
jgi:3-deoxy-D-manno-octulosonic-acid transferase